MPEQMVKSENEHDEKKIEKLEDVGEGPKKGHLLV